MKVAIFSEYYHPKVGGLQARAKGLAENLAKLSVDVTVYTVRHDPNLPETEFVEGVQVCRHDVRAYANPRLRFFRRDPFGMVQYALYCRRAAFGDFDLLYFSEFPIIHAALVPRALRRKVVMDWCEFRHGVVFTMIQKWLPRLFRWNIAVSDNIAAKMEAISGCPHHCLPSGIETHQFCPSEKDRSGLIFVGRLQPHKKIPLMISAFEVLCARGYGENLVIVGEGEMEQEVRERCAASVYSNQIVLTGGISEEEKCRLMSQARALLLVSEREGFPVSVSEAAASDTPVVTVDFPLNGTAWVVRQFGCGLITAPQPDAIADGIEKLLAERKSYLPACRKLARELDWAELVRRLLEQLGYEDQVSPVDNMWASMAEKESKSAVAG